MVVIGVLIGSTEPRVRRLDSPRERFSSPSCRGWCCARLDRSCDRLSESCARRPRCSGKPIAAAGPGIPVIVRLVLTTVVYGAVLLATRALQAELGALLPRASRAGSSISECPHQISERPAWPRGPVSAVREARQLLSSPVMTATACSAPGEFEYWRCRRCSAIFFPNVPADLGRYFDTNGYGAAAKPSHRRSARRERAKLDLLAPYVPGRRLLRLAPALVTSPGRRKQPALT